MKEFIKTDDPHVLRVMAGAETDQVAPGPYTIAGGHWVYDAEEVDKRFGEDNGLSGQFVLRIEQSDGFTKILIPADEGDGHSAGEAAHALLALNRYDALVKALKWIEQIAEAEIGRHRFAVSFRRIVDIAFDARVNGHLPGADAGIHKGQTP